MVRPTSPGSACGMKPTRRARSDGLVAKRLRPPSCTVPEAGRNPTTARSSVDLPAPFGPASTVTVPAVSGASVTPETTARRP